MLKAKAKRDQEIVEASFKKSNDKQLEKESHSLS